MQFCGALTRPVCRCVWISTCPSLVALPLHLHQHVHNGQDTITVGAVCADASTRLSSRSDGGGVMEGGWGGSGPGFCKRTHDNDELGMSPRQQAASSIIHLGNKLINEVNEEEQRQRKSCRKRHLEAGGSGGILRRILISEVYNKVWTQGHPRDEGCGAEVRAFRKWDSPPPKNVLNHPCKDMQVLKRICISAEWSYVVTSSHVIIDPPCNHSYVRPAHQTPQHSPTIRKHTTDPFSTQVSPRQSH